MGRVILSDKIKRDPKIVNVQSVTLQLHFIRETSELSDQANVFNNNIVFILE